MQYYADRTPSSYVEQDEGSVSWVYRHCDSEWAFKQARDLQMNLQHGLGTTGFVVVTERGLVQARDSSLSKGTLLTSCLDRFDREYPPGVDFVLCAGSFLQHDEDAFDVVQKRAARRASGVELSADSSRAELEVFTCAVGNLRPSRARFGLRSTEVPQLLDALIAGATGAQLHVPLQAPSAPDSPVTPEV